MDAGWFYSPTQIVRYFSTRVTSLKPPKVSAAFNLFSSSDNLLRRYFLEQTSKSIRDSERAHITSMAYVCCGLSGLDMGFFRLLHRIDDNY
jgi:hypothetical protein